MKLYIKNMVCNRCIMVVKAELEKFGLHLTNIELGQVEITEELNNKNKKELNEVLLTYGFVLMDDKKSRVIEQIKNIIIEQVRYSKEPLKINLSNFISDNLHLNYHYLSNLFTKVEGTTIEHYYLAQKTERIKELLVYDELSLGEIALQLNYSSVSHLSKQFKKFTGLTPSHFKQLKVQKRRPIDEL